MNYVFDALFLKHQFNHSKILDSSLVNQLVRVCRFPNSQMWELKYQGTRDGFKSTDFHKKCDGIRNTLTVVKTMNGNIFGGHAEKPWHSKGEFTKGDGHSFLF